MKVLFLGAPDRLEPWYSDVAAPAAPRHDVTLFDPTRALVDQFWGVDVVVDQGGSVGTREMMDAAADAGVKLWQVLGTGLDHVDVAYLFEKGLTVANTPGLFSAPALAEHALFFVLLFAKHYRLSQAKITQGAFYQPMNEELEGRTLALVGLGASARELARRARAFGMRIVAVDVADFDQAVLDELGVEFLGTPGDLEKIARDADYLSIHTPLTPDTHHLVGADVLAAMRPTAVVVNVARGPIIDEDALLDAVDRGVIRGAGLDAFSEEPLPPDHPFLHREEIVVTPHVAGMTDGTSRRRGLAVVENIDRVARAEPPLWQVTHA